MITQNRLKELLSCEDGHFVWRIDRKGKGFRGGLAPRGSLSLMTSVRKRVRITVDGELYFVHHLVWIYFNGELSRDKEIDHIDGDSTNNRVENLREVSHKQNMENRTSASKNNKSGFLGVYRAGEKFRSCVRHNGQTHHVGTFDTAEEAHDEYIKKKRSLHTHCSI